MVLTQVNALELNHVRWNLSRPHFFPLFPDYLVPPPRFLTVDTMLGPPATSKDVSWVKGAVPLSPSPSVLPAVITGMVISLHLFFELSVLKLER